jgi:hypothetical protein
MRKLCLVLLPLLALSLASAAPAAAAGTITLHNASSVTIPYVFFYNNCLGSNAVLTYPNVTPGFFDSRPRTFQVLGACVWAREGGVEPRAISCFNQINIPDPNAATISR